MHYNNLNELIDNSKSSRDYFLTLPVGMQRSLHKYNDCIRTAQELHSFVSNMEKNERAVQISNLLF